ncbi:MAG: large conductance mechanosensitive channel protein MscL [Bryobacterales bacterium]|nr:large conductance mechanosensitive channel protein MscL [Bryobacterales bacterium]
MSLASEFQEFAMKGSVVDMAVGVIVGGAFGKIATSLTTDVIMPPIGLLLGKVDFNNLFIDLSGKGHPTLAAAKAAGAPTLNYGIFIQTCLDFFIVAFVIFMVIRYVNKLRGAKPAPAA